MPEPMNLSKKAGEAKVDGHGNQTEPMDMLLQSVNNTKSGKAEAISDNVDSEYSPDHLDGSADVKAVAQKVRTVVKEDADSVVEEDVGKENQPQEDNVEKAGLSDSKSLCFFNDSKGTFFLIFPYIPNKIGVGIKLLNY